MITTIEKFNLAISDEYKKFKEHQNKFLELLEVSYGKSRYWGNDIYIQKIKKRRLSIYLMFSSENDKKILIGTIFIKPRGKLSGMAILKKYRGKGFSQTLIKRTIKDYDNVYAEIAVDNQLLRKLLGDLEFKIVKKKERINDLLFNEEIQFLNDKDILCYYHSSDKSKIDRLRKFIMYEYTKIK